MTGEQAAGRVADPMIGQLVGDFRVERQLGSGGMGAVYVMRHLEHPNTRKVLKVMLKEHVGNAFLRERFKAEADALSQLGDHPCIVGMENFTTLGDGQLAIVMQFCKGTPLESYVLARGGKLAAHRAFYAVAHIARALHHAHSRDIVHRDLKPANVFVEDDDNDVMRCRLLDFGVARRLNPNPTIPSNTVSGPLGTPDFMGPEQQDRAAQATAAADVFSLAVMLWWMVTGGMPWGQQTDPAILYVRKLQDPPDPPPVNAFPPGWEDSLRAALRPDPAARPSLRQLMQALAVGLPSIGRQVLSGAEILQRYCRKLCDESLPDDMTLRNNSQRTLVPAWPEREPSGRVASSPPDTPAPHVQQANPSSAPHATMSPMPVGAPALPLGGFATPFSMSPGSGTVIASNTSHAPFMAGMTTLGGSSGMVGPTATIAAPRAWKLAALGVGLALVVGSATFAIATARGRGAAVDPARAPRLLPTSTSSSPTAPSEARSVATGPAATAPSVPVADPPAMPTPAGTAPAAPASAAIAPTTAAATAITQGTGGSAARAPAVTAPAKVRVTGTPPAPPPKRRADPAPSLPANTATTKDRKFDPDAVIGQ